MTLLLAAFTASALSGTAQAHEISLETGAFNAPDDGYRYFDEDYAVLTRGVRGAFALSEHWAVAGSWATANEGLTVESDEGQVLLATGFRHHRVAVGPRFSWQMAPWFTPYASLQGLVWTGTARLDDNPEIDDNPGQYTFRSAAVGGQAMLGAFVEPFTLGKQDGAPRVGVYGELGYGHTTRMSFSDEGNRDLATGEAISLGDLQFHGVVGNAGLSLRF